LDFFHKFFFENARIFLVFHRSMPHLLVSNGVVGTTHNGVKMDQKYVFYYIIMKIYILVCTNIYSPIYFIYMTIM
jgi:hypothetical protein